jgi:hypothetical protein
MSNEELALIFHLLEQLGLAIKNIWWHDQVSARHEMMFDILRHIKSRLRRRRAELNVLHANEMARAFFPRQPPGLEAFDFNDLPQVIGGKVFEVLKTGQPVVDFKYQSTTALASVFRSPSRPSARTIPPAPTAALLVVEDCTPPTAFANWKSRPPICAWSSKWPNGWRTKSATPSCPFPPTNNLLRERIADPDFQAVPGGGHGGRGQARQPAGRSNALPGARPHGQMESVPVKQLIEEAFREARSYHPSTTSSCCSMNPPANRLSVSCDRQGLQHAFAEIILNALQANNASCQVQVRTRTETDSSGSRWARIEVQDSGAGFSAEAAGKAAEPFFTTRKVGLGLGLAVTSKIIQTHSGKMEIPPPRSGSRSE